MYDQPNLTKISVFKSSDRQGGFGKFNGMSTQHCYIAFKNIVHEIKNYGCV